MVHIFVFSLFFNRQHCNAKNYKEFGKRVMVNEKNMDLLYITYVSNKNSPFSNKLVSHCSIADIFQKQPIDFQGNGPVTGQ